MDHRNQLKKPQWWSTTSYIILSGFFLVIFLIGYVWWPLLADYLSLIDKNLPIWQQLDWLLIGIFLFMSVLIMIYADLKRDIPLILISLVAGYVIEAWGTRSGLWVYYTFETPPLWIIPAWPIAALSVYRMYLFSLKLLKNIPGFWFKWGYWPLFGLFYLLLMNFAWPTLSHSLTIFSLCFCAILILTSQDHRSAIIILCVGSALGYFLERWGTTRLCWEYYTGGTPPFFTVIAHGMASLAIWRVYQCYLGLLLKLNLKIRKFLLPTENKYQT